MSDQAGRERLDRADHDIAWRALASRLGLELPGMLPRPTLERLVAAEIRRRRWHLSDKNTRVLEPKHGTRGCWEQGCRLPECVKAASVAKGKQRRLAPLPSLRLPIGGTRP